MKKCLLIAPLFNGYYEDIIQSIKKIGFSVDFERDQVSDNTISFIRKRLSKNYIKKTTNKYVDSICRRHEDVYEVVIIILAYTFSKENVQQIKSHFSQSTIIYYAWDSVSNFERIKELASVCDYAFSFDRNDCEKYGYSFLPLFFVKRSANDSTKEYSYSTVMSVYPTKMKQLEKVFCLLPNNLKNQKYLVIKSKLFYIYYKLRYRKLFKKYHMHDFKYQGLSRDKVYKLFEKSRVVLDIPLESQSGLTMRTFEALALNCKIITTNSSIREYDFYNKENVFVIDGKTNMIPIAFFEKEFDQRFKISDKYSIDSFVQTMFSCLKKEK